MAHALGVPIDRIEAGDHRGLARFTERGTKQILSHELDTVGRHVAIALAGYLAERRYLTREKPPLQPRRAHALGGATDDLASIERYNPFSPVIELTSWHEQARLISWRSPEYWQAFTVAWMREAGRLVRQLWPHIEAVADEVMNSDGLLKGRALMRALKPVPRWAWRPVWTPAWSPVWQAK